MFSGVGMLFVRTAVLAVLPRGRASTLLSALLVTLILLMAGVRMLATLLARFRRLLWIILEIASCHFESFLVLR